MDTLLAKTLELENLSQAWNAIADNQGSAGVDHVSIRQWRRNWEERLVNLAQAVRSNTYKPRKLRLRRIPKHNRRETRILRIPTISDRVLQRAVLQTLHPVFERRFLDCSFGYRPKRGLDDAVRRIIVLRENGYQQVVDADIDDFFNSVDHTLLLNFLHHDLPDDSLLPIITRWLAIGRSVPDRAVGIPLGSPLSPLWANVFLHRLDVSVANQGWDMVRYADDFVVFAEHERSARQAYEWVEEVLSSLRLCYENHKTRLTSFVEGFDFIGVHFEQDEYSYVYMDKEIRVSGDELDWLFSRYGQEYP